MLPSELGTDMVRNHTITELSEGAQNFYNGECFTVDIEDVDNFEEIFELLKKACVNFGYYVM